jgi:hypothetical protein
MAAWMVCLLYPDLTHRIAGHLLIRCVQLTEVRYALDKRSWMVMTRIGWTCPYADLRADGFGCLRQSGAQTFLS